MVVVIELGALIFALFLLYLLMNFITDPIGIVLNSVIGIIALLIINLMGVGVPINIITVGIVAIGGILGLFLILLIRLLGLGF